MARGTTLNTLVEQLRAEIGASTSPAVGQEQLARLQQLLRRHQEVLYDDYDWPFLRIRDADKALAAGQRYYDFPSTINSDRVGKVMTKWGSQWIPVNFGIDPEREYNVFDPAESGDRNDPVQKWDWYDDGGSLQFEVWPTPSTAGTIRFQGLKPLTPMVANSDAAVLDDRLIVLFAAAEFLQGRPDARVKENLAAARLRRLKGNLSKSGPVKVGGDYQDRRGRQPVTVRISGA